MGETVVANDISLGHLRKVLYILLVDEWLNLSKMAKSTTMVAAVTDNTSTARETGAPVFQLHG